MDLWFITYSGQKRPVFNLQSRSHNIQTKLIEDLTYVHFKVTSFQAHVYAY